MYEEITRGCNTGLSKGYNTGHLSLQIFVVMRQTEEITPRNGTPLQYSCLENPMDGGAW